MTLSAKTLIWRPSPSDAGFCRAASALDSTKSATRENPPVAAHNRRFKLARLACEDARGDRLRAVNDECWQVEDLGLGEFERVQRTVGAANRFNQRRRAVRKRNLAAKRRKVDRAALRMQIELAFGKLGHLCWAAGDGEARDRLLAQIFQQAAGEISHLDQRMIGQAVKRADRSLRRLAGRTPVLPGGLWAPDEAQRAQTHPAPGSAR